MKNKAALALWGIVALAAGLRIAFWTLPPYEAVQYEEAVVGLVARHILLGEFAPLLWAQPYQGTFESYLAAPLFFFFGSSTALLRIIPFLISLAGVVCAYFLGKTLFNKKIGLLAALYLAVPPALLMRFSLVPFPGYLILIPVGALLMLWTYNLLFRPRFVRFPRLHCFGVGAACGFLLWQHLMATPLVLATALLFLACDRLLWRGGRFAWIFLGGALGGLPLWWWNIKNGFLSYHAAAHGPGSGAETEKWRLLLEKILPDVLGLGLEPWQKAVFYVVAVPAALWLAGLSIKGLLNLARRDKGNWEGATFLWVYFAAIILVFVFSEHREGRYLFPLYVVVPLLAACFASRWERRAAWIAPAVMFFLAGLHASGHAAYAFLVKDRPRGELRATLDFLKEQGITHVFAHNRVALPILFESREEVKAADLTRYTYNRFFVGGRGVDMERYHEIALEALGQEKAAYVSNEKWMFPRGDEMEEWFRSLKAEYRRRDFGDYAVFYNIAPTHGPLREVFSGRFRLRSPSLASRLESAVDRNISTAWSVTGKNPGEETLEIEFETPLRLGKIFLTSGDRVNDIPYTLLAEVSADGKTWKRAIDLSRGAFAFDWFGPICRMTHAAERHLYFSGEKVKAVRLALARKNHRPWRVAELAVYEAAGQELRAAFPEVEAAKTFAEALVREEVQAIYGPEDVIFRLKPFLPATVRTVDFLESPKTPLSKSSAVVDFEGVNAWIAPPGGGEDLRRQIERLGMSKRVAHRSGEWELWVTQPGPYLPNMVWNDGRLLDYLSRSESREWAELGEVEWGRQRAGIARACYEASMKKYPNAVSYARLKECCRQLGRKEEMAELEKKWKPVFEPSIARSEVFGGKIRLAGVALPENKIIRPGDTVQIGCLWECLKAVDGAVAVFVHMIRSGEVGFQADHELHRDAEPTTEWRPGEKIADLYDVAVPKGVAAGNYEIYVGLFDPRREKGARLKVTDGEGKKRGSRVKIGELVCE